MMPGYRLVHPRLRGCTLVVHHPLKTRPYELTLDGEGAVIVSRVIWERLNEAKAHGFPHGLEFSNIVENPPDQNCQVKTMALLPGQQAKIEQAMQTLVPPGVRSVTITQGSQHG